jgi:hypothetical protein
MTTKKYPCSNNSGVDCWQDVQNSPGANVMAALYNLGDKGQLADGASGNSVISSVVSYGFTVATTQCKQSFVVKQSTDLDCNNAVQAKKVANNSNCTICKQYVDEIFKMREDLENEAHANNPSYKIQKPNEQAVDLINGKLSNHDDGLCQYVCMQCIVRNLNQDINFTIDTSCMVNSSSFISAFTSGMSYQAQVELTKHQNALKNAGYKIQKDADIDTMSVHLANSITDMTLDVSLNNLQTNALNVQETKISNGSTSVIMENVKQSITTNMLATIVSSIYNDVTVKQNINYKQKQQEIEIETNFSDFVKDISASANTMDQLLSDIIGKVLMGLIVILLIVLIIVSFLIKFESSAVFGAAFQNNNT